MSCPDCFKGGVHDHNTEPKGTIENLYDYSCYVASPPAGSTSKSAILFLTDAFGLNLLNNKLLADRYAAEVGCKVVVPDIIPGGAAPTHVLGLMDTMLDPVAWTDIGGQFARIWAGCQAIFWMVPFMYRANPKSAYPSILKFARDMRKDLPAGGKLGVCGFCWGGYGSTYLCAEPIEEGGSAQLIDAQFCAHPSAMKMPDVILTAVTKFKVPYSLAIGDIDMAMKVQVIYEAEAALKEKVGEPEANNYEIKIYKDCRHGFAARPRQGVQVELEGSEDAAKQAVAWFNKYLN